MLSKLKAKLKKRGIIGSTLDFFFYVFPRRSSYLKSFQDRFHSKIGLEIGGPSSIFGENGLLPIYPLAQRIDNCNFNPSTVWEGNIQVSEGFLFHKNKCRGQQFIGEASNLSFIPDETYDFIASSHCIEHTANPIKCIQEWKRVLKTNGFLLLVIPHKDGTFDHNRAVTKLDHLIFDYKNNTSESDKTHLDEILQKHDLTMDPEAGNLNSFKKRSMLNTENRCLHHHVFNTRLAIEFINYCKMQILFVEARRPYHIIMLLKKCDNQAPENSSFPIESQFSSDNF